MNYYEHHIGDFAEATAHLSFVEDAAYSRLIRKYYAQEKPLPTDIKAVQRLVGARSRDEREAVESVLREFFDLQDDGWHQARCDVEIARYHEKAPDRDAKRENERERQRRTRERRKQIFDALRDVGVIPAFDAPMSQLNALLSQHNITAASQPVTRDVTPPVTRDYTATQTPDTSPQSPDPNTHTPSAATDVVRDPGENDPLPAQGPTRAGHLCRLMRQAGIADTNPGHPDLIALAEAGVSDAEAQGAARTAVERGKGFAYAIGTLKRQRIEAAQVAQQLHQGAMPQRQPTQRESDALVAGYMTGAIPMPTAQPRPQADEPETIDVESRLIAP